MEKFPWVLLFYRFVSSSHLATSLWLYRHAGWLWDLSGGDFWWKGDLSPCTKCEAFEFSTWSKSAIHLLSHACAHIVTHHQPDTGLSVRQSRVCFFLALPFLLPSSIASWLPLPSSPQACHPRAALMHCPVSSTSFTSADIHFSC